MSNGPNLGFVEYLAQGTGWFNALKALLRGLDGLTMPGVKDKDLTSPPGSPANGDRYIVGAAATGAWSGHDDEIARYQTSDVEGGSGWEFFTPKEGWRVWVDDEDLVYSYGGSAWAPPAVAGGGSVEGVCCGRLTLESGVAISTTDQTAKTTIYWTPYKGTKIALYNGTTWDVITFAETSLALGTLTSGKNYDVFGYSNAGTLALELSAAWTNDTTRADALALQDGVYVKSGTATRRYLGTFRTTSTTTTEDSGGGSTTQVGGKRFVWNYYNRVARYLAVIDTVSTFSYTTDTWQYFNAASGNRVEYVVGWPEDMVTARSFTGVQVTSTSTRTAKVSIGLDSATSPSRLIGEAFNSAATTVVQTLTTEYAAAATLGYHFLSWMQKGADGTNNWHGTNGATCQSGLQGCVFG